MTPATRKSVPAAAIMRSRMCAASAGVPMKTIRSGAPVASDTDGGGGLPIGLALLDHFRDLAAIEFAFDTADAIDEELAVEMIDLVLQRYREQVVGLDLDFFLAWRPGPHQHSFSALHICRKSDHREASLFPHDRTLGFDHLRIDQLEQVFARI